MFKPYYGYCKFCDKDGQLIAVKSLHCQKCNYELKQSKKKAAGKKTGRYVYKRIPTGENSVFESIVEGLSDTETVCFVCKIRVPIITHSNIAHVLPKGRYPKMRLDPNNLVVLCHKIVADENGQGCHYAYDMTPHSELKGEGWERLFELRDQLKETYKTLTDL
jgi:hypothetical protein